MKKTTIFLGLVATFCLWASEPSIVKELQLDIKTNYLRKLEKEFGDCGSDPSSCMSQRSDYMVATLPKAEVCLPYTMCGFYHCMEEKYHCSDVGVNYFTQLAFPTCSKYVQNISENKFSTVAVNWIYSVMVCLQKGLVDECELKNNCAHKTAIDRCNHITEFTLSYHPGCYIKSGVGVCHLPLKDKLAIWKTVNPFMTARERVEAYKVIFKCIMPLSNKEN